jgi:hypothetical protein
MPNEDALGGFGVVTPCRSLLLQQAHRHGYVLHWPFHGRILGVPWLDDGGDSLANLFRGRRQGESIKDH